MKRLHWERHGKHLDLCDGDELVGSIETRRHRHGPTTYHWVLTGKASLYGMTTTLADAKRALSLYAMG